MTTTEHDDPCAWCGTDLRDHDRNERGFCQSQHDLHLHLAEKAGPPQSFKWDEDRIFDWND